jgi:hypothetical protein
MLRLEAAFQQKICWLVSVVILLLVTAMALPATGQEIPEDDGDSRGGIYRTANHVATVNIQGGRKCPEMSCNTGASAYSGFNWRITDVNSGNTVQSRVIDRGNYIHGLAAQEVCQTNWVNIIDKLEDADIMPVSVGGMGSTAKFAIWGGLYGPCGAWYGIGILIRGAFGATPAGGVYSPANQASGDHARVWLCARTYIVLCNTHITDDNAFDSQQVNEFRGVANYAAGTAPGLSTYAAGDFNIQPDDGSSWLQYFTNDNWRDADNLQFQQTTDDGQRIDYILRKNPRTWSHDAYVASWVYTDHHWKQGYM